MLLMIVLFASLLTPILAGWETPLESTAKARFRLKFVGCAAALLPKISPQEREEISKGAAIASQRARCQDSVRMAAFGATAPLQASAPTRMKVVKFLASEAQVQKPCPDCDDKDYSDP